MATQHQYGVPAAVTIAQAIDESGWGRSELAMRAHNLFGMKGAGPAGSIALPTQEFEHGRLVTRLGSFRVYRDIAQSVEDHARLLAMSGHYQQAMTDREDPNAFAAALTGVYATDPGYGAKLIRLMRSYDLYRYDLTRQPASAGTPGLAAHAADLSGPVPGRAAVSSTAVSSTAVSNGAAGAVPAGAVPAGAPLPAGEGVAAGAAHIAGAHITAAGFSGAPVFGPPDSAGPGAADAARASHDPRVQPAARGTRGGSPAGVTELDALFQARLAEPVPRRPQAASPQPVRRRASRYQPHIPLSVRDVFFATARGPLLRAEPLYRDVSMRRGIRWELLAACDWMQCEARPRHSPVHGEKLGTLNPDGTSYRTKSQALAQCAEDLADLAWAVYRIDLPGNGELSVRDLANVFGAFRWGALLERHRISAMEFPYSVAGLTEQHLNMRWPDVPDPDVPDRPGSRFRRPFGAVPIVLGLNYPATVL